MGLAEHLGHEFVDGLAIVAKTQQEAFPRRAAFRAGNPLGEAYGRLAGCEFEQVLRLA